MSKELGKELENKWLDFWGDYTVDVAGGLERVARDSFVAGHAAIASVAPAPTASATETAETFANAICDNLKHGWLSLSDKEMVKQIATAALTAAEQAGRAQQIAELAASTDNFMKVVCENKHFFWNHALHEAETRLYHALAAPLTGAAGGGQKWTLKLLSLN